MATDWDRARRMLGALEELGSSWDRGAAEDLLSSALTSGEQAERRVAELEARVSELEGAVAAANELIGEYVGTNEALTAARAEADALRAQVESLAGANSQAAETIHALVASEAGLRAQVETLTRERQVEAAESERLRKLDARRAEAQRERAETAERALGEARDHLGREARDLRIERTQRDTREKALREALLDYACHARESGWHNLAEEIERRAALASEAAPADWSPASGTELVAGAMAAGVLGAALPAPAPEAAGTGAPEAAPGCATCGGTGYVETPGTGDGDRCGEDCPACSTPSAPEAAGTGQTKVEPCAYCGQPESHGDHWMSTGSTDYHRFRLASPAPETTKGEDRE